MGLRSSPASGYHVPALLPLRAAPINDFDLPDAKTRTALRRRIFNWYRKNSRDLPWRNQSDPYKVWVSEIMLQQTQVVTVIDYYKRFIKQFPTVKKLAAAREPEILKLWEGLGYYRRARQLHAAAQVIVEKYGGKFPTDFDEVLALPGIGRYTAGAILSISGDQRLPILEGNTIRVFSRLMLLDGDTTSRENQNALWAFSEQLLPRKRAGDFNQALMELGSEVCKRSNPLCSDCPIRLHCAARAHHRQSELPRPKKPPKYEEINEAVIVARRNDKILMRLCGNEERWAGLWDFPRFQITSRAAEAQLSNDLHEATALSTVVANTNRTIKHAVTRFRITLDCFEATEVSGKLKQQTAYKWVTLKELVDLPLSVTGRKVSKLI